MRFEKLETLLRVAFAMRGTAEGVSLAEIEREHGVSRRTAERMRDAVERVFPQIEQANPGEVPKRWRIRGGLNAIVGVSVEELAALGAAAALMRRDNLAEPAGRLESLAAKLKALLPHEAARRLGPDLELLAEAEGLALRPGPRQAIAPETVARLREAILACRKVRLTYRARGTGARSVNLVCPYGFLYGNRHYLVADSLNPQARGMRLWGLGNIEAVRMTDTFVRRNDFSLQDFAEQAFGAFQEKPFAVEWRFSPRAAADARAFLFHPSQTMQDEPDGALTVRFRAGGALEMCWHLVTWGSEVEVIKPKRLQQLFARVRAGEA